MLLRMEQGKLPKLHTQAAWYGSVMGTGATSSLLYVTYERVEWPVLLWGAIALLWLATATAVLLWPRYFRRLRKRNELAHEIADPAHGAMLATFPAGLLVLAIAWGSVGPETIPNNLALSIAGALLIVGGLAALIYSPLWASVISRVEVPLAKVNGGWLIPVVMNLLVPIAMVPIIQEFPNQAPVLIAIGFGFLGIGSVLFIAVFTLLIVRIATQGSLPSALVPSLWVPLAPAGVFGIGLIRLFQSGVEAGIINEDLLVLAEIMAAMSVGFGLWWAIFAGIDMRRAVKNGGIPFHLGWWGVVVPVVSMAIAINLLDLLFDSVVIVALTSTAIGLGVWLFVATTTIVAVIADRNARSASE
jgi:tellurite resistance protein TehA-like permease